MGASEAGISAFIGKLNSILEDPHSFQFIRWAPAGNSFIIIDPTEFSTHILPYHFKHTNLSSFVRQLNKYSFHKIKSDEDIKNLYGENVWEFGNDNFIAGRMDLMAKITRKRSITDVKRSPKLQSQNISNNINSESEDAYFEDDQHSTMFNNYLINSMAALTRQMEMVHRELICLREIVRELMPNKKRMAEFSGIRILVAEENAGSSDFANIFLRNAGFEVSTVEGIGEFSKFYQCDLFDAILVSGEIPDVQGIISTIRSINRKIPIVLSTESHTPSDSLFKAFIGINGVIYKPFDPIDLIETIGKVVKVSKGVNDPRFSNAPINSKKI